MWPTTMLFVQYSGGQYSLQESILNKYDLLVNFYLQTRKNWVCFSHDVVDILFPMSKIMAIQMIVFLFE
jgi:hypothetical protein